MVGFATGLTVFATIGPQNAFMLRQGIRNEHIVALVLFCTAADFTFITTGILGVGALVTAHPQLTAAIRYGGVVFLVGYGLLAARRALRPAALVPAGHGPDRLSAALLTCAALTFLNPHVFLDTVALSSIANQHGDRRWLFGAGVAVASAVWFVSLGFGARRLSGAFAAPRTWRILDAIIAATMLTLGVTLAVT